MADVVNLNRFRKRKQRDDQRVQAERNRAVHGRTKAEKRLTRFEQAKAEREHEGRKLEGKADEAEDDASDSAAEASIEPPEDDPSR